MAAKATRELNNLFLEAVQNGLQNDDMKKTVDQKNKMKMKHTTAPINWYKFAGIRRLIYVKVKAVLIPPLPYVAGKKIRNHSPG